ncbi:hypothetical protein Sya03_43490 [Spirilliplanes yamanashiensis]|uniref:Capsular polysaccharide biosynthesis protein n=2 Tax=Spirilliplanes yamanashiensis TaxID=42233 RepID=A0A8J3YC10_9ACTN|nr:hypothetical protein Sya03_43490 [Spirilliplanes yamanashiensis]
MPRSGELHVTSTATHLYGRRHYSLLSLAAVALAVIAVFAGAAVGYSILLQPRVYGAQADFLITPRADISDAAVDRAMVTQVMIVTSDPVLQPVADRSGLPLSRVRRNVDAEIVGRSNLLRLTVSDPDQARAVELARLVTEQYLLRSAPPAVGPAIATAVATTPATPAPSAGATDAPAETPAETPAEAPVADPPPTRSTVLSPAALLEDPLQPQPRRALAGGLLLGLLAAAVTVAVLERPRWLTRPFASWR